MKLNYTVLLRYYFLIYAKGSFKELFQKAIQPISKHKCIISLSILGFKWNSSTAKDNLQIASNKYWLTNDLSSLIEEADRLFNEQAYVAVYEFLNRIKYYKNVEVLWRICQALHKLSLDESISNTVKQNMIAEAYDIISRAIELTDNSPEVHKWMAIILDAKCNLEGTTSKVKNALKIKEHMMRAVELNPNDAALLHMLGKWCFDFTNLTWVQRKIAVVLYADPPVSSYEEAFDYFSRAETISPRFYIGNLVMLGKISLKLKRYHQAQYYLHIAQHLPVFTEEEQLLAKEASLLAKQLHNYDLSQKAL